MEIMNSVNFKDLTFAIENNLRNLVLNFLFFYLGKRRHLWFMEIIFY